MESANSRPLATMRQVWAGRIVSALPVLMLLMSGVMKLIKPAAVVESFAHLGYSDSLALPLGIVELACTVLYIVPQTAVLGAILLTGYLGGAVAIQARSGAELFSLVFPLIIGALLWGGLFLRDPQLRSLVPLRR